MIHHRRSGRTGRANPCNSSCIDKICCTYCGNDQYNWDPEVRILALRQPCIPRSPCCLKRRKKEYKVDGEQLEWCLKSYDREIKRRKNQPIGR